MHSCDDSLQAAPGSGHFRFAFTLIELLVVIAIIAILAAMLLPVLAHAKLEGQQAIDLANKKQVQLSWQMYADDFQQVMCPNAPLGIAKPGETWCPGQGESWAAFIDNTNTALFDQCLLAPYLAKQIAVYKCPGDSILSGDSQVRLRSISMNSQMGWIYMQGLQDNYSEPFRFYTKTTDLFCPVPSLAFIFADETMYTMDDGFMQMPTPTGPGFPNAPAYYLGVGCFSFADGHAENHKWTGPVLPKLPYAYGVTGGGGNNSTSGTDPDFLWLSNHCACVSNAPAGSF